MKTLNTIYHSNRLYDVETIINSDFPDKKIAYFDIETTGLSPAGSQIYLIGVAYRNEDGSFTIIQWFDDTSKDEMKLLIKFREFIKKFDYLIEFNGNSFDIPFVKERGKKSGVNINFNKLVPIDIYKDIRKFKNLFKLPNVKQKTLEKFLGIDRLDMYSGGELIDIYKDYVKTGSKNEEYLNLLLLHNLDDMKGLVDICDILPYIRLFDGHFSLKSIILMDNNAMIECNIDSPLPVEIFDLADRISFKAHNNILKLLIPITNGTFKYFYENYKDYFYLPHEDTAIHKSVAQFVDKSCREKAKKETCYIKKDSSFLIQYSEIIKPAFKENYKDKVSFFEINEDIIQEILIDEDKRKIFVGYVRDVIGRFV